MSNIAKRIIRICTGLIFVLPYGITKEGDLITVKALLWEADLGKIGSMPYLRIRCPHIISALLK